MVVQVIVTCYGDKCMVMKAIPICWEAIPMGLEAISTFSRVMWMGLYETGTCRGVICIVLEAILICWKTVGCVWRPYQCVVGQ